MPKRNRHREAMKAGQLSPMKLARAAVKADAAKPAPTTTTQQAASAEPAKPAKKPRITAPPLTPEERRIKARLRRKRNEAKHKLLRPEILATLAERWPAAFPADPAKVRPLAIGVHEEIERAMPEYAKRALRVAVRKITNSEGYLTLIAAGGLALKEGFAKGSTTPSQRYDHYGNPAGEITEDAKRDALERLAAKRAKKAGTA